MCRHSPGRFKSTQKKTNFIMTSKPFQRMKFSSGSLESMERRKGKDLGKIKYKGF